MTHLVKLGNPLDAQGYKIACVGVEVMGHSWATLFATKSYRVILHDVNDENLRRAMDWIKTALELLAEKGIIAHSEIEPSLGRVTPTTDLGEAVGDADFVLESVYEDYGARHISVPIAAGEQWSSKWGFREVIEEELINYARIDLCIAGGLTEALKITHWRETHFIDIAPHNPLGPVAAAACVALCTASTNVGVQEMPRRPGSFATGLFPKQIGWEDGYAFAPDVPGLGVEFDEEPAEERRVQPTGWPSLLRRNDGAFTNW
jgi:hypothetical protein